MDWRAMEAAADAAVIGAFSELVRHFPYTSGGAVDPTRPIADIRGVLHTPTPAGTISLGANFLTTLSASEGALVIERAKYPTTVFRAKDRIRGLEFAGSVFWEVKTVNDRYSSIIVLALTQV